VYIVTIGRRNLYENSNEIFSVLFVFAATKKREAKFIAPLYNTEGIAEQTIDGTSNSKKKKNYYDIIKRKTENEKRSK